MQKLKKLTLKNLEAEVPVIREIDSKKLFGGTQPTTTLPLCYFDSLNWLDDHFGNAHTDSFYYTNFTQQYGFGWINDGVTPDEANVFSGEYFNVTTNLAQSSWQNFLSNDGYIMTDINQGGNVSHAVIITGYNAATGEYNYHDATNNTDSHGSASMFDASIEIGFCGSQTPE